ncbi:MAG: ATPase, T2SS/T4P/T4SS family [Burkholderiaceae bacterium]
MISLIVEADGRPAESLRVEHFPCRIGRLRGNEVLLPSWRVARVHAEIHRLDAGFKLVDGGSLGGTWVNGERVVEYGPLADTDEIVIAGFRLRVLVARGGGAGRAAVTGHDDDWRLPEAPPEGRAEPTNAPGVGRGQAPSNEDGAPAPATFPGDPGHPLVPPDRMVAPRRDAVPIAAHPKRPRAAADTASPGVASRGGVVEPPAQSAVADTLEWRRLLHRRLLQTIDLRRKDVRQLSSAHLRAEARVLLEEIVSADVKLPAQVDAAALLDDVLDEAIGLGPLESLLSDPSVSEIMVNAPDEIFVERHGRLSRCRAAFSGEGAIRAVIDRIVAPLGRRIDESSPMVDARLPDGSRVNAVIPPLAVRGSAVTIRRFNRQVLAPPDLVRLGSLSPAMVEFLRLCVVHRRSIVISGGTGSGKTTLLNVLSNLIPEDERIVTIEDAAELRLEHAHLVSLESRPPNNEGRGAVGIRELVRNALRMRPDRIVVGECRGGEALDMLQAMNTGHDGSLTTVHANSPRDVIARLETMVLMAGMDLPVAAIRDQIASAVHVIVQQARGADGVRRIVEIAEVTGIEGSRVLMHPLFRFERGRFASCGAMPQFFETLRERGVEIEAAAFFAGAAA